MLSDAHLITSAKIRIFFQIFIILALVLYSGIAIRDIRIASLDYLLNYKLISIIFTVFCILVLINGSNFIDGVNTLLCGYVVLVLLSVIYVSYKNFLILDQIFFINKMDTNDMSDNFLKHIKDIHGKDLYVIINLQTDERYEVHGTTVVTNLEINSIEAMLGTEKEVLGVDGKTFLVKIPAEIGRAHV